MTTTLSNLSSPMADTVRIVIDSFTRATIHAGVDLVEDTLSYKVQEFESGGPLGVRQHLRTERFYVTDHRGRPVTSPGMVPVVKKTLETAGKTVAVDDRRKLPWELAVDADAVAAARGDDRRLLDALAASPHGQIEVDGERDLINTLLYLCVTAFPTLDILIPVATRRRAWVLWDKLRQYMGRNVQLAKGRWDKIGRVTVCPYTFVREPKAWHVVLLPDASTLASGTAVEKVATALGGPKRVYAFVPAAARFDCLQTMAIQNVAGPVIYRVNPKPASVTVAVCPSGSRPRVEGLAGLAYKRAAYWHNDRRNDDVADVATALAAKDLNTLWSHGLLLDRPADYLDGFGDHARVVVLVESAEHGKELARRLPGWTLLSMNTDRRRKPDPAGHRVAGHIVTSTYAARHGIEADVLVRAGGGVGLKVNNFPANMTGDLLLVDVNDDFDGRSANDARRRLDNYARLGWHVGTTHGPFANRGGKTLPAETNSTRTSPACRVTGHGDGNHTLAPKCRPNAMAGSNNGPTGAARPADPNRTPAATTTTAGMKNPVPPTPTASRHGREATHPTSDSRTSGYGDQGKRKRGNPTAETNETAERRKG